MIEIKRPSGSIHTIASLVGSTADLTVLASIQNLTPGTTYLQFWNTELASWQEAQHQSTVPPVVNNPGLYTMQLDHATLGAGNDDLVLVVVSEATTSFREATLVRFGDSDTATLRSIAAATAPARKEIVRVTDNSLYIAHYSAPSGGSEIMRIDVQHDPSGAQPEEVQTLTFTEP